MSDDNQIIPLENLALSTQDDKAFEDVVESSGFLPRIQLFGANSGAVKEELIQQGRYGLVKGKEDITDLGKDVLCLPLAFRFKALDVSGDDIITNYDHTSDEFKRIKEASEVKDSQCMFGPEFLIWLPELETMTTYYLSSKSSRREGKPLRALIGKAASLGVKLVKTKKFSWHAPVISASSAGMKPPETELMKAELEKFRNPESDEVADGEDDTRR